jgi:hypothetical protein
MSQLQGMMGMGMGAKPFENVMRPATTGFMGAMAPGIGAALGGAMTGGLGGLGVMGGGLSSLMNLFKSPTPQVGYGYQPGYGMFHAG